MKASCGLTLRAVILDWAGTAVDFGSMAPVAAFAAAFQSARVPVSVEEIRKCMGLEKRRHISEMLADRAIAARWRSIHGASPSARDLDDLYTAFYEQLVAILPEYADPIPGLLAAIASLRSAGIKIGSNSGYSTRMMDVLSSAARDRGFEPDCIVSSSDVSAGRPAPDLSQKCLDLLGLDQDGPAIKVDDTRAGIEEGRNAGLWTVGVAVSGNEVGLPLQEWSALDAYEQARLRERAHKSLRAAHPDYVIDTVADLEVVVKLIEARIAFGERPAAR